MKLTYIILLFLLAILASNTSAQAALPKYRFSDLGTLGGTNSYAYAINNQGQIVGMALNPDGLYRATLFDFTGQAKNIDLGTLGGSSGESCAMAINNHGQIVGRDYDLNGNWRAALFDATGAGNNISLGSLGGDTSIAEAISDSSIVVGWSNTAMDESGRSCWHSAQFDITGAGLNIDLDGGQSGYSIARCVNALGLVAGNADENAMLLDLSSQSGLVNFGSQTDCNAILAINNSGQMAGCSDASSSSVGHAMLLNRINGILSATDLGDIGGMGSCATSINSSGIVVGYVITESGAWHAAMFDTTGDANNIDLNAFVDPNLGWELQNAFINDKGQICGFGKRPDGAIHAYLLDPVLEQNKYMSAPVLNMPATVSSQEGQAISLPVTVTNRDANSIIYAALYLPKGATLQNSTFIWTPDFSQAGTYTITFIAINQIAATSKDVRITVAHTNRSPVMNPVAAKTIGKLQRLDFAVTASDPDGDNLTYSAKNLPAGAAFVNGAFSWTPSAIGTYKVELGASDGQLTASQTVSITVTVVNTAPVLKTIAPCTVNENGSLTLALSGSDIDGNRLTYSATGLPTGATLTGNAFKWTPSYTQAGSYNVTFSVSDGAAKTSQTVAIKVNNVDRPPVFASIANQSIKKGATVKLSVTAADPDGTAVTYSVKTLPAGASFIGNVFTWKPAAIGTYSVSFVAASGGVSVTKTVTITVK